MSEVKTDWCQATTDVNDAIMSLMSCAAIHPDAWIELRENGNQTWPIMTPNPLLGNPFNWTSVCGYLNNRDNAAKKNYLNETERDLVQNWVDAFGTEEAIKAYQVNGDIRKDLMMSGGISHPIRKTDANKHRERFVKDGYVFGDYWVYMWKPKDGIPYHVPVTLPTKVFTVCYTDSEISMATAARRAAEFMVQIAEQYENKN